MGLITLDAIIRQVSGADVRALINDEFVGVHWSQFGEDVALAEMLLPRFPTGRYVDVGAHHPRRYSNTRLLNLAGWSGVNIDADPTAVEALRQERPRDVNIHAAVASAAGSVELHRFVDSAVNTISAAQAEQWGARWERVEPLRVPAQPLSVLLADHLAEGDPIHFLNVDAEGMDLEVLSTHDFDRNPTYTIAVEIHDLDLHDAASNSTVEFLSGRAFVLKGYVHVTALFDRQDA